MLLNIIRFDSLIWAAKGRGSRCDGGMSTLVKHMRSIQDLSALYSVDRSMKIIASALFYTST